MSEEDWWRGAGKGRVDPGDHGVCKEGRQEYHKLRRGSKQESSVRNPWEREDTPEQGDRGGFHEGAGYEGRGRITENQREMMFPAMLATAGREPLPSLGQGSSARAVTGI